MFAELDRLRLYRKLAMHFPIRRQTDVIILDWNVENGTGMKKGLFQTTPLSFPRLLFGLTQPDQFVSYNR
jgi:hypothetical protein